MLDVTFDLNAINAKLDGITKAAESAVREAAQAGAEMFYVEMKLRAQALFADDRKSKPGEHWFYGTSSKKAAKGNKKANAYLFQQGTLAKSIYQYYNKRLSRPGHAVYSVSWNHKEAPYGYMVEFGTSRASARPFLRPAYSAAKDDAQRAVLGTLQASIKKGLEK